jgi:hypothetical protein
LGKTGVGVGNDFAAKFTVGQAQGAVQLGFSNVNTEMKQRHRNPQMIYLVNAGYRLKPKQGIINNFPSLLSQHDSQLTTFGKFGAVQ